MAKLGRPYKYEEDEVRPVTISLRIPPELAEQLKAYAARHRQSVTDIVIDGIRMRLETPTDPRDIILSDDNTVIQEVQDMIQIAVEREVDKRQAFMASAHGALTVPPAPEAPAAPTPTLSYDNNTIIQETAEAAPVDVPDISHDSNTVLQQQAPKRPGRPDTMRQRILALLAAHAEGLSAEQIRGYLSPGKPLGDVLQGMKRSGVVRVHGSGKTLRYVAV